MDRNNQNRRFPLKFPSDGSGIGTDLARPFNAQTKSTDKCVMPIKSSSSNVDHNDRAQHRFGLKSEDRYEHFQGREDTDRDMMQIALAESIHTLKIKEREDADLEKAMKESMKMYKTAQKYTSNTERKSGMKDIKNLKGEISFPKCVIRPILHGSDSQSMTRARVSQYDFIVGRGRNVPKNYMNFPLNPRLQSRNLIYIDPNPVMDSDIKLMLHEVDFSYFGICKDQDPDEDIMVRFFFDWSSFYCGAMQNLTNTVLRIGRRCQIFVPLNKDENQIPADVKRELCSDIFTLNLVGGKYPMFDWTSTEQVINGMTRSLSNVSFMDADINPKCYLRIDAYTNF